MIPLRTIPMVQKKARAPDILGPLAPLVQRREESQACDFARRLVARPANAVPSNNSVAGSGVPVIWSCPFPEGTSSVSFPLSEYDAATRRAVFENLAHDFPTHISYQRVARDRLTITVSGPGEDGNEQVLTYALRRQ
jgi:hypothetical protein